MEFAQVFVIHCEPNFSLPWQRKRQYASSSTGFIIDGQRILTNAHCIDHHTQVKLKRRGSNEKFEAAVLAIGAECDLVKLKGQGSDEKFVATVLAIGAVKLKRRGSDEKFVATVLAIGAECDLALLTVDDPRFWESSESVKFGVLPALQDPVMVVGYPIGGDTMSVTSGVQPDFHTYTLAGASELLGIQIDAAINSGNSGGPAFSEEGLCIGVAFQSLKHEDAENIGYVIPTPVVQHFINDYERNKRYTGFPWLGLEWQKTESPDLREMLKMKPNQKGVMVRRLEPTAAASKKGVLQALGTDCSGKQVGKTLTIDQNIEFDEIESCYTKAIPKKYVNEEATLRLLHAGKEVTVKVGPVKLNADQNDLTKPNQSKNMNEEAALSLLHAGKEVTVKVKLLAPVRLIPWHILNKPPSYFIVAGLMFTPITVPYLRSEYGKDYEFDAPVKLLDKMAHSMANSEGEQVTNLKDLVRAVESCTASFLEFDLEYNQKVVLNTKRAKVATKEIMITHCIPSDRSPDLVGI
eukprot:gene19876-26576_t